MENRKVEEEEGEKEEEERERKKNEEGENTPLGVAINVRLLLSQRLQAEILCGV